MTGIADELASWGWLGNFKASSIILHNLLTIFRCRKILFAPTYVGHLGNSA